jgi:hypothetical protein
MGGDGGGFVPAEHHSGGAAGQLGSMGTSSIAHPRAPQHPRGGGVAVAAATTPGRAGRTLRRRHAAGRWGGRGWWLACWIVRWVDPLLGRAASQAALPLGLTLALHLRPQKHRAAHPQNSRFTPRCPSVVLWTPCSGVEWGVYRTDHQGLEKRQRRASSLRTWRWRVRRRPCPSCPSTHPPYVPRPSALDHL